MTETALRVTKYGSFHLLYNISLQTSVVQWYNLASWSWLASLRGSRAVNCFETLVTHRATIFWDLSLFYRHFGLVLQLFMTDKRVPVLKKKKVAILKKFGQVKLFATWFSFRHCNYSSIKREDIKIKARHFTWYLLALKITVK